MELVPRADTVRTPRERFTGDVYLTPVLPRSDPSPLIVSLVRFTPGARTNWHSHANGQALHVTEGEGVCVSRDGTVVHMRAGDTVWTPAGEEHWHGATATAMMAHLAIIEATADGDGTTWLEPVSDRDHDAATS